jgi:hypothetical protein
MRFLTFYIFVTNTQYNDDLNGSHTYSSFSSPSLLGDDLVYICIVVSGIFLALLNIPRQSRHHMYCVQTP